MPEARKLRSVAIGAILLAAWMSRAETYPAIELTAGYDQAHPRLLFSAADTAALQQKAKDHPEFWEPVLSQAKRLSSYTPDKETIRTGSKYWRTEWVFSGALAFTLTGEQPYRDGAVNWMKAHCLEDTWGVGWRENIDLFASWYLYYISLSYDLLLDQLTPEEEGVIRQGLAAHARAIYDARETGRITYDQNHTYIPVAALVTAALALKGKEPDAGKWLDYGHDLMDKCRSVLNPDGYYYEGSGYWEYAVHWHIRYADLISRATDSNAHDHPFLRNNYLYALHLGLPGAPYAFDIGDTGVGAGKRQQERQLGRKTFLYRLASAFNDDRPQLVADSIRRRGPAWEDPAMTFLWYDPSVADADLSKLPTHHHFEDFGVVCWRSSWEPDATVCMFKCGPPNGYSADAKLKEMPRWRPNTGHVHPDIGMFWIYARGAYLATDTGYTSRKQTRDHNTLLVDGKGMGEDRTYWIYSGFPDKDIPYSKWMPARLEKVHVEDEYVYALGDFSTAYPEDLGALTIRRHFVATRDFQIVYDELSGARSHEYTWLLHADNAFEERNDQVFSTTADPARLSAHVLSPAEVTAKAGTAICFSKDSPHKGKEEPRGYELALTTDGAVDRGHFLIVLIPQRSDEPRAQVRLAALTGKAIEIEISGPDGRHQRARLQLDWSPDSDTGPLILTTVGQ